MRQTLIFLQISQIVDKLSSSTVTEPTNCWLGHFWVFFLFFLNSTKGCVLVSGLVLNDIYKKLSVQDFLLKLIETNQSPGWSTYRNMSLKLVCEAPNTGPAFDHFVAGDTKLEDLGANEGESNIKSTLIKEAVYEMSRNYYTVCLWVLLWHWWAVCVPIWLEHFVSHLRFDEVNLKIKIQFFFFSFFSPMSRIHELMPVTKIIK